MHKLDVIIGSKSSYREVFKPENISLRNKYVQIIPLLSPKLYRLNDDWFHIDAPSLCSISCHKGS